MEDINFYDILNSNYKAMSDIEKVGKKDYVQNLVNTYVSVDSKGIAGSKR